MGSPGISEAEKVKKHRTCLLKSHSDRHDYLSAAAVWMNVLPVTRFSSRWVAQVALSVDGNLAHKSFLVFSCVCKEARMSGKL